MKQPKPRWFICHFCFCSYPNQGIYEDHLVKFHSSKKKKRSYLFQYTRPKLPLSPSSSLSSVSSSSPSRNEINNSESDAEVEMIMVPETPMKFKEEFSMDENEVVSDSPINSSSSGTSSPMSVGSVADDDFEHFEASIGNKSSTPIAVDEPVSLDDDDESANEQFEGLGLEKERRVNKGCKEYEQVIKNFQEFRNSKGKLNFQCKVSNCRRILQSKVSTHQHWRIHSGERPFKCKICDRLFANITNMRRHYDVLHLGIRKNNVKPKSKGVKKVVVKVKKAAKKQKQPQIKIETVINDDAWLVEPSRIDVIAQRMISKKYTKSKSK